MAIIYALLLRGERANVTSLAAKLEVDERTVQRDLDFMRYRLGLPLEYNKSFFTWELTDTEPRPWWLARPGDEEFKSRPGCRTAFPRTNVFSTTLPWRTCNS